jgi:hypothetical protein
MGSRAIHALTAFSTERRPIVVAIRSNGDISMPRPKVNSL